MINAPLEQQSLEKPFVVDLDGTLLRSDLLFETAFEVLGRNPLSLIPMIRSLVLGKASLKHYLAQNSDVKPELLPYDQSVLQRIRHAKAQGRKVYLASASNRRLVTAVADHLGLFDGTFSSDETTNLAGPAKADLLTRTFGAQGFDYVGNDKADLPVWESASGRIGVRCSSSVAKRLVSLGGNTEVIPSSASADLVTWLKQLRVHQYSKNALVFVPLVTSQSFGVDSIFRSILAFIAFSACASSLYIINDIIDLAADRSHPTKFTRPIASGVIPISRALVVVMILLLLGISLATIVSLPFLGILLSYAALTTAYTFYLKRKLLVDVITLAGLYTARVIAGAAAIDVMVSQWLLGFSLFIFTTLALVKRYTELTVRLDKKLEDPTNRNYRVADLPVIAALAAASAFNSVTVFALYVSSDSVRALYHRPEALWLFCPILMYWLGRVLILAHRRQMHDDPIVFALRDKISYMALACAALALLAAKFI
jgi:4-hydroxybenzoate polyprenyltransferase/phosphoserine phosphatase